MPKFITFEIKARPPWGVLPTKDVSPSRHGQSAVCPNPGNSEKTRRWLNPLRVAIVPGAMRILVTCFCISLACSKPHKPDRLVVDEQCLKECRSDKTIDTRHHHLPSCMSRCLVKPFSVFDSALDGGALLLPVDVFRNNFFGHDAGFAEEGSQAQ